MYFRRAYWHISIIVSLQTTGVTGTVHTYISPLLTFHSVLLKHPPRINRPSVAPATFPPIVSETCSVTTVTFILLANHADNNGNYNSSLNECNCAVLNTPKRYSPSLSLFKMIHFVYKGLTKTSLFAMYCPMNVSKPMIITRPMRSFTRYIMVIVPWVWVWLAKLVGNQTLLRTTEWRAVRVPAGTNGHSDVNCTVKCSFLSPLTLHTE